MSRMVRPRPRPIEKAVKAEPCSSENQKAPAAEAVASYNPKTHELVPLQMLQLFQLQLDRLELLLQRLASLDIRVSPPAEPVPAKPVAAYEQPQQDAGNIWGQALKERHSGNGPVRF